jgi:hypothetical protein
LFEFPLGLDPLIVGALLGALGLAFMARFTRSELGLHAGNLQAFASIIRRLLKKLNQ